MKDMKLKRPWPQWVQVVVKKLAKCVTGEDVDQLRKEAVGAEFRLKSLWAASMRVWRQHGHAAGQPKDDLEWLDLQTELEKVKIKPQAGQPQPVSA